VLKLIPAMSSRKFVRLLENGGARFVRQRGTSHAIYERIVNNVKLRAPVVIGKQELSPICINLRGSERRLSRLGAGLSRFGTKRRTVSKPEMESCIETK